VGAIAVEKAKLNEPLGTITEDLGGAVEFIEANLRPVEGLYDPYIRTDDKVRWRLN
jgi:hypothetical protein